LHSCAGKVQEDFDFSNSFLPPRFLRSKTKTDRVSSAQDERLRRQTRSGPQLPVKAMPPNRRSGFVLAPRGAASRLDCRNELAPRSSDSISPLTALLKR